MELIKKIIVKAMHKKLSELDSLYQCRAGEECYLFGGGISLKWMDLNHFVDRPCIIGNVFFFHKDARALNIPYCTNIEPTFFYPVCPIHSDGKILLVRHPYCKEYRQIIMQNPKTIFFINISNYPVARFPNALYVNRFYRPQFYEKNPFIDRLDTFHGTFKFQVALAIYLGFKRAYLVGHDYTHFPPKIYHFYEKGKGVLSGHRKYYQDYIDYAKRYIDLITVTLDAGCETMKSITYEELTGKKPFFRENVELIDRDKLEALDRGKIYKIF